MADNKIVHRISLEGADKVAKQLDAIGDSGEKAFKRVKQSADGASNVGKAGAALGDTVSVEKDLERSRIAAERFRESIHILHPLLGAAGLEIGGLGSYARLAGAGLGALGAVIAGSVLIGLAKIAEQADKAKRRLDLLSGAGRGGGGSQFDGLKKIASDLGVDSSDFAPAAESLFRSQQNSRSADRTVTHPDNFVAGANEDAANQVQVFRGGDATPSAGLSSETISAAIKASAEAGRLDRTSAKDSAAALAGLYESTKGGKGQVTVDAYDALAKASPAIGDAVAKAASGSGAGGVGQGLPAGAPDLRAFLQRGGKLSGDQVLTGLARTEPALREKAEAVPPGISESFDHLEAAAKRVAEAFSGDGGIAGAVDKFAKTIDGVADNIDKTLHPKDYQQGGSKFIGPVRPEDAPSSPKSLGEVFTSNKGDLLGRIVSYILGGKDSPKNGFGGANPLGAVTDFTKKAVTDPGSFQERERPEAGAAPQTTHSPRSEPQPLGFDRTSDGLLIKQGPSTEPPPSEYIQPPSPQDQQKLEQDRTLGPAPTYPQQTAPPSQPPLLQQGGRNFGQAEPSPDAGGVVQPQQLASLGENFQSFIDRVSAALTKPLSKSDLDQSGQPVSGVGIRGDNSDGAVAHAAEGARISFAEGGQAARLNVSPGGRLSGPGTGKSDSIKADVANGEFVVNAEDTAKNLDLLHAINSGKEAGGNDGTHFADGGLAGPSPSGGGQYSVTFDPDTGGAYVNGALYPPGSPILDDPTIKQLIEQSKASLNEKQPTPKHKSEFVGPFGGHVFNTAGEYSGGGLVAAFARGGLVGGRSGLSSRVARFAKGGAVNFSDRIAAMGLSTIDVPHLAIGGMPDMPSADLSNSTLKQANSNGLDLPHYGTVDMRTDHGDHRMITQEDTMRHLSASAQKAKRYSTGAKPGWYGGGGL